MRGRLPRCLGANPSGTTMLLGVIVTQYSLKVLSLARNQQEQPMKLRVKKSLDNILDTFGGVDGGISFVQLKTLVEQLASRAETGDESAAEVLNVMFRFERLIEVAKKT
jgi:hypothetical protein